MSRALAKQIRSTRMKQGSRSPLAGWQASIAAAVRWGDPAATRLIAGKARESIVKGMAGRWLRDAEQLLAVVSEGRRWRMVTFESLKLKSDHYRALACIGTVRDCVDVDAPAATNVIAWNLASLAQEFGRTERADDLPLFMVWAELTIAQTALHEAAHFLAPIVGLPTWTKANFALAVSMPSKPRAPGTAQVNHGPRWAQAYSLLVERALSGRGRSALRENHLLDAPGFRRLFRTIVHDDMASHAGRPGEAIVDAATACIAGRGPWHMPIQEMLSAELPVALSDLFSEAGERSSAAA